MRRLKSGNLSTNTFLIFAVWTNINSDSCLSTDFSLAFTYMYVFIQISRAVSVSESSYRLAVAHDSCWLSRRLSSFRANICNKCKQLIYDSWHWLIFFGKVIGSKKACLTLEVDERCIFVPRLFKTYKFDMRSIYEDRKEVESAYWHPLFN